MVQLITTYRHDYPPPITNRYKFKESEIKKPVECADPCDCCKPYQSKHTPITLPEAKKTNLRLEWTGVAPMGRLIEPRIIPPDGDINLGISHKTTASECIEDQPNRFLKVLQQSYPDLYERLKQMPDNDLKQRLNVERLKTTYQIDFCRIPEYPDGIYSSKVMEEKDKNMAIIEDGCEHLKNQVQVNLAPAKYDEKCQASQNGTKRNDLQPAFKDTTSHWAVDKEFVKKPPITEYMDKLSRTGCIIMRNQIHDHSNCGGEKNCAHVLRKPCRTFK